VGFENGKSMLKRRYIAATVLLLVLSACGGGDDTSTPRQLEFSVLDTTSQSGIQAARFTVAKTDAEWQALWSEDKASVLPRPAVDLQSKMVLGVFVGERVDGCFTAEIMRVVQEAGTIRVEYRDLPPPLRPDQGCSGNITHPGVLATVARSDLPVTFSKVSQ
jgi:hypothetical protein